MFRSLLFLYFFCAMKQIEMIRQPLIVCSFNSFCYICSVNSKIEPKHSNRTKT